MSLPAKKIRGSLWWVGIFGVLMASAACRSQEGPGAVELPDRLPDDQRPAAAELSLAKSLLSDATVAGPVTLRYQFQAGKILQFQAFIHQTAEVIGPDMPAARSDVVIKATLVQQVVTVKADGTTLDIAMQAPTVELQPEMPSVAEGLRQTLSKLHYQLDIDVHGQIAAVRAVSGMDNDLRLAFEELTPVLPSLMPVLPTAAVQQGQSWTCAAIPKTGPAVEPCRFAGLVLPKGATASLALIDIDSPLDAQGQIDSLGVHGRWIGGGQLRGRILFDPTLGQIEQAEFNLAERQMIAGRTQDETRRFEQYRTVHVTLQRADTKPPASEAQPEGNDSSTSSTKISVPRGKP